MLGFEDYAARDFVYWYNSYPDIKPVKLPPNIQNVTIVGNGNVAVDISRILLKSSDKLQKTDINLDALDEIS